MGVVSRSASCAATLRDLLAGSGCELAWVHATVDATAADVELVLFDVDTCDPVGAARAGELAGVPVVAVTARAGAGTTRVYDAMGHGAVDVVALDAGAVAFAAVVRRNLGTRASYVPTGAPPLLAVGASTGGPQAVGEILGSLPRDLGAAVVVCQHVEPSFFGELVACLSADARRAVTPIAARVAPRAGDVLLAVPGAHVELEGGELVPVPARADSLHAPSIDRLFTSLARGARRHSTAGVLLTGMGRDGAAGLRAMREAGCLTIAQDEATSVVYSMPRAAKELRAASRILPLGAIGPSLAAFVAGLARPA